MKQGVVLGEGGFELGVGGGVGVGRGGRRAGAADDELRVLREDAGDFGGAVDAGDAGEKAAGQDGGEDVAGRGRCGGEGVQDELVVEDIEFWRGRGVGGEEGAQVGGDAGGDVGLELAGGADEGAGRVV